jgi:hypothetical protein
MKIFQNGKGQAHQDSFVLNALKEKQNGFYVEIGAQDPFTWNNTAILENEYGWTGVAFEIIPELTENYNNNRRNPCIQGDATTFDYLNYFKQNNFPKQIDYLQLDIEPAEQTLNALYKLPLLEYRFSVITYEHDLYADPKNSLIKAEAQGVFKALGYRLVSENVTDGIDTRPFEDWWIDPNVVKDFSIDS